MSEIEAMRAPVCLVEHGSGRPCLAEATVAMESGCVHEHVFTERICESCASLADAGQAYCRTCWEGGHWCVLLSRRAKTP